MFFGCSNSEIDVRLTGENKFNVVHMGAQRFQGRVVQLRLMCHPELRDGIGAWAIKGRGG